MISSEFLPVLLMLLGNALRAQSRELWITAGAPILSHTEKNELLGSPSTDGDPGDVQKPPIKEFSKNIKHSICSASWGCNTFRRLILIYSGLSHALHLIV
jgi:hypothetical protein